MVFEDNIKIGPSPKQSQRWHTNAPATVYGRKWSLVIVDEAHVARKYNKYYLAFRGLRERAFATFALTATPVLTTPSVSTGLRFIDSFISSMTIGTLGAWSLARCSWFRHNPEP